MKVNRFLARHPVFTGEEFAAFRVAQGTNGARSAEALLAYHRPWSSRSARFRSVRVSRAPLKNDAADTQVTTVDRAALDKGPWA